MPVRNCLLIMMLMSGLGVAMAASVHAVSTQVGAQVAFVQVLRAESQSSLQLVATGQDDVLSQSGPAMLSLQPPAHTAVEVSCGVSAQVTGRDGRARRLDDISLSNRPCVGVGWPVVVATGGRAVQLRLGGRLAVAREVAAAAALPDVAPVTIQLVYQ